MKADEFKVGDRVVVDHAEIAVWMRKPGKIISINYRDQIDHNNNTAKVQFDEPAVDPAYGDVYRQYDFFWHTLKKVDEKLKYNGSCPEEDFFGKEFLEDTVEVVVEEVPSTSGPDVPPTEEGNPFGHLKI